MALPPREITLFISAARTATANGADQINEAGHRGLSVFIDSTAVSGASSVVFTVQGKEPLADEYYTILASAAITATGNTILRIFPSSTVTANTHANDQLPLTWRLIATHGTADSTTYAVTAVLLP